jgi:hypothetical protein
MIRDSFVIAGDVPGGGGSRDECMNGGRYVYKEKAKFRETFRSD